MTMLTLDRLLNTHNSYLLGHRGARGEVFENSLAGFIHTQKLSQRSEGKLVGIEFDVQLTKDGKLLVFHDDSLLRLYKQQARVDQCSFDELKRLSLQLINNVSHPLMVLEEMPPVLQGYSHIELEIKTHKRTNYNLLIEALKKALSITELSDLPITLTSFDLMLHQLMATDEFLKGLKRGLLIQPVEDKTNNKTKAQKVDEKKSGDSLKEFDLKSPVSTGQPLINTPSLANKLGCVSVGLFHPLFNADIMQICHSYSLSTSAWTVNKPEEAKQLILLGVNYIITDYPSVFLNS